MGATLSRATQRAQQQIRYVTPVGRRAARGLVAQVYRQAEREFGLIAPPLSLHSPAPGPLAASWLMLRETLIAGGSASRATKEAVAAAVSLGNACPYCVEVHGATLHGLTRHRDAVAIAEDRIDSVTDPRLREIAAWARASGSLDGTARLGAPIAAGQVPELVGVAVTFQT
jgi:AhpD family alkylhydroperoxidase